MPGKPPEHTRLWLLLHTHQPHHGLSGTRNHRLAAGLHLLDQLGQPLNPVFSCPKTLLYGFETAALDG
jgi:hypothetical protein